MERTNQLIIIPAGGGASSSRKTVNKVTTPITEHIQHSEQSVIVVYSCNNNEKTCDVNSLSKRKDDMIFFFLSILGMKLGKLGKKI